MVNLIDNVVSIHFRILYRMIIVLMSVFFLLQDLRKQIAPLLKGFQAEVSCLNILLVFIIINS